jgi:5-methylcytosine-specific restriction endonuclease McrA
MSTSHSTTPTKRCSTCGEWKSLTPEYWTREAKSPDGYHYRCKSCKRRYDENARRKKSIPVRRTPHVDGMKRCSYCKEWKPATHDFFGVDRRNWDGFQSACRVCGSAIAKRTRDPVRKHQYYLSYYLANADAIRRRTNAYYYANIDAAKEQRRRWRERNADKLREQKRQYRIKNRDRLLEKDRRYRAEHRDAKREQDALYYRNNRERYYVHAYNRRARKRSLPATFTRKDMKRALKYFNGCCAYCGQQRDFWDNLHADHFIPLSSPECPGTIPTNMLPACKHCNLTKSNRAPDEWLVWKFGKRRAKSILARIQAYFDTL